MHFNSNKVYVPSDLILLAIGCLDCKQGVQFCFRAAKATCFFLKSEAGKTKTFLVVAQKKNSQLAMAADIERTTCSFVPLADDLHMDYEI